jgi:endothelin-converting enzyme/putative endopeptidase
MAEPGSSALVSAAVAPDAVRPNLWLVHLANADGPQPVLGLPGRGDYLGQDAPAQARRAAYRAYVAATLARAGVDGAERRAADVLALETASPNASGIPRACATSGPTTAHVPGRAGRLRPGLPLGRVPRAPRGGRRREVVLGTDSAVRANARLFAETPVDAWRSYLAFHWLQNHVDALPAAFQRASHAFYRQRLAGVTTPWQWDPGRGTAFVDRYLGEPLGRLYVARYFPPEARAQVAAMVGHLRAAFADRLARADWMDDATRAEAQAKLAALTVKIGYPDRWRDLSGAALDPADLYGNVRRLRAAESAEQRAALVRPPVRGAIWYQTPQSVDATNSQRLVSIEFPAGILQPPFFDPGGRPGGQLRRDRRDHRPRARARVRRPGLALRPHGPAARLVDAGDAGALRRARPGAGRPVRRVRAAAGGARQRPADARRDPGRPPGPHARPRRLPAVPARERRRPGGGRPGRRGRQ